MNTIFRSLTIKRAHSSFAKSSSRLTSRVLCKRSSSRIQEQRQTIFSTASINKTYIFTSVRPINTKSDFIWTWIKQAFGQSDASASPATIEAEALAQKYAEYPQYKLYMEAQKAQKMLKFEKAEELLVEALNMEVDEINAGDILPLIKQISYFRILHLDIMRVDQKILLQEMLAHLEDFDNKNPHIWIGFIKLLIEGKDINGALEAVQRFRAIDAEWDRDTLANLAYLEGNIMESLEKDEEAKKHYEQALRLVFSPVFDDALHHVNKRLRNKS